MAIRSISNSNQNVRMGVEGKMVSANRYLRGIISEIICPSNERLCFLLHLRWHLKDAVLITWDCYRLVSATKKHICDGSLSQETVLWAELLFVKRQKSCCMTYLNDLYSVALCSNYFDIWMVLLYPSSGKYPVQDMCIKDRDIAVSSVIQIIKSWNTLGKWKGLLILTKME